MASTRAIELILSVSPAQWCQACFLLAACGVLAVATAPSAERKLLVNYGARGSTSKEDGGDTSTTSTNDNILGAIRKVTSLGQIPHSWFMSFYASYLVCAAFWAVQYLQGGHVIRFIAGRQQQAGSPSMTRGQVMLAWSLMLLQAARRLYECIVLAKPSRSTMWIVHWLLGLCFYLGISCAIWIEGSAALVQDLPEAGDGTITTEALVKAAVAVPVFAYAWIMQHRCHGHLAGLKKYSLPDTGLFRYLICPHYTCECLLYLSLAVAAAPDGQLCNQTLASALIFVAANLGVTAHGTRNWYIEKFGSDKVAGRRILIPFVY